MLTIVRRYEAEVAHRLTAGVPERHKCRRLHGHRYVIEIAVSGDLDSTGMIFEYAELDSTIRPIIAALDHHDANTINERCSTAEAASFAENPTVERMVVWLATRLRLVKSIRQEQRLRLEWISVEEDSRSRVEWRPSPTGESTREPTPSKEPGGE